MFTFCLVLNQSKQKCNAIKIKCRYRFSIMSIKRFRFHDQTFAFLRSNVSVSMIKRFCFYDQTFSLYRYNGNYS